MKECVHEKRKRIYPAWNCGTAEEVTKVLAFLAYSDASFMYGQILVIDESRSVTYPTLVDI